MTPVRLRRKIRGIPAANRVESASTAADWGEGHSAVVPGSRVVVAHADFGTREGIRLALEAAGHEVEVYADEAADVIDAVSRNAPRVCLIDLELRGGGLKIAAWIVANVRGTHVLLVADDVSDNDLFDALRVGVSGFVLRGMNGTRLPRVLEGVLRGEIALPRNLAGRVAREFRDRGRRRLVTLADARGVELTTREWEVLDLLRSGARTREISERLGIAQVTVRRHVGQILKKLAVETRADALALLDKRSRV